MDAKLIINQLDLKPHPEGGWYRETYRSNELLAATALPERYGDARSFSTAIYFLLEQNDFSSFHRIASDEIWHHYLGTPVIIYQLNKAGELTTLQLGPDLGQGQHFQIIIPAGTWFAAEPVDNNFSLVGCTVAPGFDFSDFEFAERDILLEEYPQHTGLINRLTRQLTSGGDLEVFQQQLATPKEGKAKL